MWHWPDCEVSGKIDQSNSRRVIAPQGTRTGLLTARKHQLSPCHQRLMEVRGGQGGIRTLERLSTVTHFPGVRLKPLGHLSGSLRSRTSKGSARNIAAGPQKQTVECDGLHRAVSRFPPCRASNRVRPRQSKLCSPPRHRTTPSWL